ncbi:hypothetical protein ACSBM8_16705 [Sphingomonas sp. ASY06-1R]|uniref:hypothetical protein n=1 Tax=Sphingomonas sp. ASY06-1R TaxID=3445771 RepID=UPI003FA27DBB
MMRVPLLIVTALVAATPAAACRCRAPSTPQAFARADAVAVGMVSAVRDRDTGDTILEFAVERAWKKPLARSITIRTATTCKLRASAGTRYLLFLRRDGHRGYFTTRCMGDRPNPDTALLGDVDRLARSRAR